MKLRKNPGSKKGEKSLRISRYFTLEPKLTCHHGLTVQFIWLICVSLQMHSENALPPWRSRSWQATAIFRAYRAMLVNELMYRKTKSALGWVAFGYVFCTKKLHSIWVRFDFLQFILWNIHAFDTFQLSLRHISTESAFAGCYFHFSFLCNSPVDLPSTRFCSTN